MKHQPLVWYTVEENKRLVADKLRAVVLTNGRCIHKDTAWNILRRQGLDPKYPAKSGASKRTAGQLKANIVLMAKLRRTVVPRKGTCYVPREDFLDRCQTGLPRDAKETSTLYLENEVVEGTIYIDKKDEEGIVFKNPYLVIIEIDSEN